MIGDDGIMIPECVMRFHYCRFGDLSSETREAIIQVREYERACPKGYVKGQSTSPSRLNDFNSSS